MEGLPGRTCPFPWIPLGRCPSLNAMLHTRYDVLGFVVVLEGHAPDQAKHQRGSKLKQTLSLLWKRAKSGILYTGY